MKNVLNGTDRTANKQIPSLTIDKTRHFRVDCFKAEKMGHRLPRITNIKNSELEERSNHGQTT